MPRWETSHLLSSRPEAANLFLPIHKVESGGMYGTRWEGEKVQMVQPAVVGFFCRSWGWRHIPPPDLYNVQLCTSNTVQVHIYR